MVRNNENCKARPNGVLSPRGQKNKHESKSRKEDIHTAIQVHLCSKKVEQRTNVVIRLAQKTRPGVRVVVIVAVSSSWSSSSQSSP